MKQIQRYRFMTDESGPAYEAMLARLRTLRDLGAAADRESWLDAMREMVQALVAYYMRPADAPVALAAYEAGLAAGYYGANSAVAEGLRVRLDTTGNGSHLTGFKGEFERTGRVHGALMKNYWAQVQGETAANVTSDRQREGPSG